MSFFSWSGVKGGHLEGPSLLHSLSKRVLNNITACDVLIIDIYDIQESAGTSKLCNMYKKYIVYSNK